MKSAVLLLVALAAAALSSQTALAQSTGGTDDGVWTLNWGGIAYVGDDVHAEPASDDFPSSYVFAPTQFYGDRTGYSVLDFEKMSVRGGYVDAVGQGTDGDDALENGDMCATYIIPENSPGSGTHIVFR